jgi:glycosyltransferase involved in cell wall biosynthesis
MTLDIEQSRDLTRRAIDNLLIEIDIELQKPIENHDEFAAREQRIKQRLTGPPFLAGATGLSDLASPVVSIALPTHNRAACIGDAISSVQAQSFTDWELIIVDDGSVDNTADVVAPYLDDSRIRYIAQAFAGHSASRNRALERARGALVAYIDSDNLWYPNFLEAAVVALAAFQDCDVIYGALVSERHLEIPRTILFQDFDRESLLHNNFIDLNTIVHRRSLTQAHGGFDEELTRLVDWDLLLRMTKDKPARRVPVLAALYRTVDDRRVEDIYPFEPNAAAIRRKWSGEPT